MKNFDFYIKKNNSTPKHNTFYNSSTIDYSKELDNLILADIADKNKYLFNNTSGTTKSKTIYLNNSGLKGDIITSAISFITNGKKNNFPYILGETYTLSDGTPIIFFEDSIQIGFDLYYFDDITSSIFLKTITPNLKKKIATIYTDGLKISIYK